MSREILSSTATKLEPNEGQASSVSAWFESNGFALATVQIIAALFMFVASQYGNSTLYLATAILYSSAVILTLVYAKKSSLRLMTIICSFFLFHYLPIIKYNQPLFDDAWSDLKTATFFANAGRVAELPLFPNPTLQQYSQWPMLHLIGVTVSDVSAVSLFDLWSYLAPIIALPSLLFVYYLAVEFFGDSRKAAVSAFILSAFSLSMFWQIQMVRTNLGITIFCAGLYTYVKARKSNSESMIILWLLFFSVLPLVHHVTSLVALATIVLAFILDWAYWKSSSLSLTFLLFVGAVTLLAWSAYQGGYFWPAFFGRALSLLFPQGGRFNIVVSKFSSHFDLFDSLSLLRVLYLGFTALVGFFSIVRRRFRFGAVIAGLLFSNLIPLALAWFVTRDVDERFSVFLVLPTAFLVAKMKPTRKLLLGLVLILVIAPTPFKLFETFNATPRYIYDANASVNFALGEFSKFREPSTLILSRWNARFNRNMPVLADEYDGDVLQQYYDPTMIYYLGPSYNLISYHPDNNLLIYYQKQYTAGRYGPSVLNDLRSLTSSADTIYSDGAQVGYYVAPQA